ncbi:MAG: hypothetical protein DRQ61_01075 [Gammaproteobacteria bacterium]|nr:MAG: hypothetical protein DRQ56_03115 [Gammaproteobacteria bacterium]RLA24359.1 MAG: hypothetical protein DRQ61_01075 [Gammaproteobacteria bacterium]
MQKFIIMLAIFMQATALNASELSLSTRKLNNVEITYNYTSGRSYNLKFAESGVSYRYLTGSKPERWWGPFPYQAFEVENNVYFVSWFEDGYGDYVTLYIDFNKDLLYGSAILSAKTVHFHGAKITSIKYK